MPRFNPDNTQGYSAAEMAALTAAYNARLDALRSDGVELDGDENKSLRDHIGEQVLAEFDAARKA